MNINSLILFVGAVALLLFVGAIIDVCVRGPNEKN